MSKGSGNGSDINIAYLEKLTESVMDATLALEKISDSYGANGQLEQTLRGLAKAVNDGNMSTKQMLKQAASTQKNIRSVEYGMEDTSRYTKTVNMFTKLLEEKLGDSKIDDALVKKITTAFENLDVTAILESEKIGAKGGKGAPLKNVMDNEKLNKVNDDLAKKLGLKLDSIQYKLVTFFENAQQKTTKVIKQLGVDMLEGLEKSKWVGGALRDTFRLVGLLGANFLSQFGQLGRILGAAFYVAMETAGPFLVKLLLQGMGKLFLSLPRMLGAIINKLPMNGPLGNAITTFYGGGTGAQKMAALKGLAAPAAVATAAFVGGGWAMGQMSDSWRKGKKGNAVAFGAGGAALIGGGIAALVGGLTAPITVPLLAIGAAVTSLSFLWKKFGGNIQDHFKKNKDFYNKVLDVLSILCPPLLIIRKIMEWISDHWPGLGKDKSGSSGGRNTGAVGGNNSNKGTGLADNVIDNKEGNFVSYGKMKVSKRDGSILNLNELTQDEASEALQMYEKADPTSFNRVYEWVGGDKASLGSHSTDAVKKVNGQTIAALSKRGTSQEIDDLRDQLVGLSPQQLAEFKQTSGKLTGSNQFHGNGGWKSHNNQYGLGIDLAGGSSWTGEDYERNLKVLQDYYGKRGYEVNLERPGQGKSTGWHYDIKPRTNMRPEGAQENFDEYEKEQQKAKAVESATKKMSISEVVKTLSPEEKEKFDKEIEKKKPKNDEDRVKLEEKILKGMGIHTNQSLNGSPWVKTDKDGNETLLKDASGNFLFSEQYIQKIANMGAN